MSAVKKSILFLINILSLVMLLAIPAYMVYRSPDLLNDLIPFQEEPEVNPGFYTVENSPEERIRRVLAREKGMEHLEQLQVMLRRFSGQQLQDGIFLTENAMYENTQEPDPRLDASGKNAEGILEFVYQYYIPTYMMLVPTACAIKQNDIPQSAPLFNQKSFIDGIYRNISGVITSADAYSALFATMDEYTYYRTMPELTGLGGYYLYSVLGERLSFRTRSMAQFEQIYLKYDYRGSLYWRLPYTNVLPDIYSYYRMSLFYREYQMTRYEIDGAIRQFDDIILPQIAEDTSKEITDVVLGGRAPLITVKAENSPYKERLLIFGDKTVRAYIPFLASHYSEIYIVDLELADLSILDKLGIRNFDQVLFSFFTDTFIQVNFSEKMMYLAR